MAGLVEMAKKKIFDFAEKSPYSGKSVDQRVQRGMREATGQTPPKPVDAVKAVPKKKKKKMKREGGMGANSIQAVLDRLAAEKRKKGK